MTEKKIIFPKEFEFLIQEILYILDSEQDVKYHSVKGQQDEHEIEGKLSLYGLDRSKIKLIENLPYVLQFAKDLIIFLEYKYGKFPEGYHYYKDAVKRMGEYLESLDSYT